MTILDVELTLYVLWFKFIFGLNFLNQFDFPLSQIMVMNIRQRKTKIKLVWKNWNP